MSKNNFHSLSAKEALEVLDTSGNGLSREESARRLQIYGKNILREEKISQLDIYLRQYKNPIVIILIAASIVSLFLKELFDFILIIGIIFINSLIGFFQEFKAETSISALKKITENKIDVIYNGEEYRINASDLVDGDIVLLREGDVISADIRLLKAIGLSVDESSLTGESVATAKEADLILPEDTPLYKLANMLFSGTTVVTGYAKGVVCRTGKHTYLASIAQKAMEKSPDSPLTRAVAFFSRNYLIGIIALIILTGIIGLLQNRDFVKMFYFLLSQLVSAVPEGLPIVLTLVLAVGSIALLKNAVYVRHLPAVETLGCTTVIASDKTGTITEGKLTVKEVFAPDMEKLRMAAALCADRHGKTTDPVELAIEQWIGEESNLINLKYPQVARYPFDAKNRLSASVNNMDEQEILIVKGAFEYLANISSNTKKDLEELKEIHDTMAANGLRILAFATGDGNISHISSWKIEIIGMIGFWDPPKINIKETITIARKAGIRVIMITGDNPITAGAIAKEIGIHTGDKKILTGDDIDNLPDEELTILLVNTSVLARVLPEHKYRIVKLLQQNREIVVVTGDGINDVPALKAADLGIAMGSGTEAAKSVAKMVVADNNLGVIVKAIRQGRVISDNIRKVIYYLVSTSLAELIIIFFSVLFRLPLPLYPTQILWINMVTDGVQDKTFPFIREENNVMERKPVKPEHQFFNKIQVFRILWATLTMSGIILTLFVYMLNAGYDYPLVVTTVFTSLVAVQWVNGIQSQKESEPFLKNIKNSFMINPYIWLGVGIGIILQYVAVYHLNDFFHTVPLSFNELLLILYAVVLTFMILEIRKWVEQALGIV